METRKELYSIYVLKALAAFAVIYIHTDFYFHDILMPFCRLAVPLFFMISGYFLANPIGQFSCDKILRNIKKIFKIWLVASCVYLVYNTIILYLKYLQGGEYYSFIDILFPDNYFQLLFFTNPYHGVLWYLMAYLQTLIILMIFERINKIDVLYKLIPLLLFLNFLLGVYNPVHAMEGYLVRNFLVTGIPFVLLGGYIRKNEILWMKIFTTYRFRIIVSVFLLMYFEYFILYAWGRLSFGDVYLSTVLGGVVCMLLGLYYKYTLKNNVLSVIGKKYSLDLYLYHYLAFLSVENVFEFFGLSLGKIAFLVAVLSTLLFSIILEYCRERVPLLRSLR